MDREGWEIDSPGQAERKSREKSEWTGIFFMSGEQNGIFILEKHAKGDIEQ